MELGLKGRRALITGATKGIGLAVAHELASEGAAVAICARNPDEVAAAEASLSQHGVALYAAPADVTDTEQLAEWVRSSASALGGIDILVNNAGAAHPGGFESLDDEDWHHDLDIKLFSQIRGVRNSLAFLRESNAPRVININAVYARYPDARFFSTSVIRAACLNLTKVLAQQYGPEGILVNSVNIGFVITPQWSRIKSVRAPELSDEDFLATSVAGEVPLGRFGTVEEVSGLVAFLASDRASYLTGASIDVAGGMGKYS